MAKAYRWDDYEMHMDEICRINPVTRIYIDEIGRENWANVFMYG